MSIVIRNAKPPVNIRPIVQEAVKALGYFRTDSADELTELVISIWPRGKSGKMLLASGVEFRHLLSEKGEKDAEHAAQATTLRIIFNIDRKRKKADERRLAEISPLVMLAGITRHCCTLAKARVNEVRDRNLRPSLPLKGCSSEWCSCRWDETE